MLELLALLVAVQIVTDLLLIVVLVRGRDRHWDSIHTKEKPE